MKETFLEVFTDKLVNTCTVLTNHMDDYTRPREAVANHISRLRAFTELAYDIGIIDYSEYLALEVVIDMVEEEADDLVEERESV